ncbi:butyrophilin subfamily 1 member A1-like [Macrotis lagotis]|uniref:butyrophilin subfamily 1 member A1-like n=1 Tax=Macrotis lagotis TaxID=92651 RepID=UPI003D6946DB
MSARLNYTEVHKGILGSASLKEEQEKPILDRPTTISQLKDTKQPNNVIRHPRVLMVRKASSSTDKCGRDGASLQLSLISWGPFSETRLEHWGWQEAPLVFMEVVKADKLSSTASPPQPSLGFFPAKSSGAKLKVVSPIHPIVARLGEDVTLSCYLSPETSAEHMKVKWFQVQISLPVHMDQDGVDMDRKTMAKNKRTSMLTHEINKGKVALKIFHVDTSDNGQYWCRFEQNGSYQEASLELKVAGLGSTPKINLKGNEDGRVQLLCTSEGWFPQPLVWWRIFEGANLSSLSEVQIQGTNGLFHVEASVEVKNDSMEYVICSIYNSLLDQEVSAFYIPEPSLLEMISSWKTLLTLGLFLLISSMAVTWNKYCSKGNNTLDSKTANPELILSEKGSCVTRGNIRHNLPDNPQRFKFLPSVLGQEKITSGRYYWVVEAGHGSGWFLGICKEDVSRKESIQVTPENGFWVMGCYGNEYWAITSPPTLLNLKVSPQRIGIFLDYHLGHLSFQNVIDGSHIHTFPTTPFSGILRPFFLLWSPDCKEPSNMLQRLGKAKRITGHQNDPIPSLRNSVAQQALPLVTGDQDSHFTPDILLSPTPTHGQRI